ncbi:SDR family NAD(P)-dependent oxidoreductase [Planomonospora venezuelensis]|uniref:NAD(P)-dependent dehydrogenase (Short-subunit alcohol dehydrogenase family) n=1 Tax=Planomonospora venezuelensis TaxID=1999 RepID=A0A841DA30_PLAVE|nr:SDR family oxidoreductase [Planomonospora venezuelensis]MBB5966850.1 NAD(P)-dependent dehydrogenase (short-subunit alcohol dehydrogenase family) [Planomonospora venezuelensis]GIN03850.1 oxidoreductase [Planomonospora venezuelensis]
MRKPYVPEEILLTGKAAVVTGAARGIGRAVAETLAGFGAEVALCDRDAIDGFGEAFAMTLDVRDPVALEVFAQGVRERFGRVDLLVNNAGGTFHAAFADVSPNGESALIAENFTQVTAVIRRFLPLMPDGSSIVNVTSSEAHQAAPGFAVYAAMKAAVESLTRSLALELAPRGIRVNAIAPDALPTAGEEAVREHMLAAPLPFEPVRLPPLGRLGDPADAAAAVVFLASRLAGFVTGATLHVDGGIHAGGGWRRV